MTLLDGRLGVGTFGGSTVKPQTAHPYFTREVGELLSADMDLKAALRRPRPASPAARLGLRFEKKVLGVLRDEFGSRFGSQISFRFTSLTRPGRAAIPDAILLSRDRAVLLVAEIKLRHTGDAYHQLHRFYLPIVRKALPLVRVAPLEIVQFYDPRVELPMQKALVANPTEAFSLRDCFHPVLIAGKNGSWR